MRRFKPVLVDAAFAAVVLAAAVPPLMQARAPWWGYALAAGTSLPLTWRRRWPFLVGIAVALAAVAYARVPGVPQAMPYGVLVVTYTLADRGTRWQRWFTLIAGPLGVIGSTNSLPDALFSYQFPILLSLSAYALGAATRTRRQYAAVLEDRARRLAIERVADAQRAAAAERERIAGDMHDILAHVVTLMVVQAEAGPVVVRTDPARAEAIFDAIANAGRDAMVQLRQLLRRTDTPGERVRRPSIESVADLADDVRRAGLAVSLTVEGESRPAPAEVEVAAYRIVQEALTNVVRHAGASVVSIRLAWTPTHLEIDVVDDGRGGPAVETAGRGLLGITHRAAECGGAAHTGTGPQGYGFTVRVQLPVPMALAAHA